MKESVRLDHDNVARLNCCPGGLEIADKKMGGELTRTVAWHRDMLDCGMTGFALRCGDVVRGFVQYMPQETAPLPVLAPGAAVLLCFHYNPPPEAAEAEHLRRESQLVQKAADDARRAGFSGLAAIGWYHPVHYPVDFLEELGFETVDRNPESALMWLPFAADAVPPEIPPQTFRPRDLSAEGRVAIDLGYSHRCPYEIHHSNRIAGLCRRFSPEQVSLNLVLTDTKKQVLASRAPSWNWHWLYVNGRQLDIPASSLDYSTLQQVSNCVAGREE